VENFAEALLGQPGHKKIIFKSQIAAANSALKIVRRNLSLIKSFCNTLNLLMVRIMFAFAEHIQYLRK